MKFGVVRAAAVGATIAGSMLAAAAATASPARVRLRDSVSPNAARTANLGAVASSTPIDFSVILKLPDPAASASFAQAVSTPGNAQYGHYLTPAQWEARFSPTDAQVAAVRAFLRQSGFTVTGVTPDRMRIDASGDATQVERAFATSLSYHSAEGHELRLADTDLSVPSDIAGTVAGVTGISETLDHPDNTTGRPAESSASSAGSPNSRPDAIAQPAGWRDPPPCGTYYSQKPDTTLPQFGQGYANNPPWVVCGYTPPQLRTAYGLTSTINGAGITVAIVDAYASPTLLSDAQQYASRNDASNPLASSQFSQRVASKFTNTAACDASGWYGEQTLDVEAVHATAPGAKILYMGAANCGASTLLSQVQTVVNNHLANVITNSYGDTAGDAIDDSSVRSATDQVLQMAASTGITVIYSSGDDGDEYTTMGIASPDYPASSPWATAVGGTTLNLGSGSQRVSEFGWSTAESYLCNQAYVTLGGCTSAQLNKWQPVDLALDGGSGGGTSYDYAQPSYQVGVVPQSLATAHAGQAGPHGTVATSPMRVVPDVSMDGDPGTGFLEGETQTFPDGVYYDQYRIGGTSVSGPLFAGVVARADQQAGKALGFVNPKLYSLAGNTDAFQDVIGAGKTDQSRGYYVNSIDSTQGILDTTRIVDYEGTERYCNSSNVCTTQKVALNAVAGYDNMTGLGTPKGHFLKHLSSP